MAREEEVIVERLRLIGGFLVNKDRGWIGVKVGGSDRDKGRSESRNLGGDFRARGRCGRATTCGCGFGPEGDLGRVAHVPSLQFFPCLPPKALVT
jgi:hypothetical protein